MNRSRANGVAGALGAAIVIGGLAYATRAAADDDGGVGNVNMGVTVTTPVTRSAPRRDSAKHPEWLNYKDCKSNVSITFPVSVSDPIGNRVLRAYMSGSLTGVPSNCLDYATRADPSLCFEFPGDVNAGFKIDTATILANLKLAGCGEGTTYVNLPVEFFFMLIDDNSKDVISMGYATYNDLSVDLWGPAAPTMKPLGIGDGQMIVNFDTTGSSDAVSYNVYSDPLASALPASCSVSDAGADASDDAGAITGASSGDSCGTSLLIPGQIPPACLPIAGTVTTGTKVVTNLTNGKSYNFAVSAIDGVDNVGTMSDTVCDTPQPVDSFFKIYCQDGGQACQAGGCGVSTLGADDAILWPALSTVAFSALGLTMIRRRRRRRAARRAPETK